MFSNNLTQEQPYDKLEAKLKKASITSKLNEKALESQSMLKTFIASVWITDLSCMKYTLDKMQDEVSYFSGKKIYLSDEHILTMKQGTLSSINSDLTKYISNYRSLLPEQIDNNLFEQAKGIQVTVRNLLNQVEHIGYLPKWLENQNNNKIEEALEIVNEVLANHLVDLDKSDIQKLKNLQDDKASYFRFIIKNPIKTINRVAVYQQYEGKLDIYSNKNKVIHLAIKITDRQGKKYFKKFPENEVVLKRNKRISSQNLADYLSFYPKCIVDKVNEERYTPNEGKKTWEGYLYGPSTCLTYKNIHHTIVSVVRSHINTADKNTVELIFLGCGNGNEVLKMIKMLKTLNIKFVIYCLEYYEKNIQYLKSELEKEYPNEELPVYLSPNPGGNHYAGIQGHAYFLDYILPKLRSTHNEKVKDQQPIYQQKFVIAAGFLTRHTSKGSKEAFDIFQKACSLTHGIIIISGFTPAIVPRGMAKKAGSRIHSFKLFVGDTRVADFNIYEFIPLDKQLNDILNKIKDNNTSELDLSNHATIIDILEKLEPYLMDHSSFTINMSNTYINTEEDNSLQRFEKIISKLKAKNIDLLVAGTEEWFDWAGKNRMASLFIVNKNLSNFYEEKNIFPKYEIVKSPKLIQRINEEIKRIENNCHTFILRGNQC
jgi:hypothetical protein